jgi:hypothetical protein
LFYLSVSPRPLTLYPLGLGEINSSIIYLETWFCLFLIMLSVIRQTSPINCTYIVVFII